MHFFKTYFLLAFGIAVIACLPTACHKTLHKHVLGSKDFALNSTESKQLNAACGNSDAYIPDLEQPLLSPKRYLKVNVHVMQDENTEFSFDEASGRKIVHALIDNANHKLRNNQQMFLPVGNTTPVLPINLEYVLTPDPDIPGHDGIYFHKNDTLMVYNKRAMRNDGQIGYRSSRKQLHRYGRHVDDVLNIFIMEHPPDSIGSATYKPSADGIAIDGRSVKVVGMYQRYQQYHKNDKDFVYFVSSFFAPLLNHEIGHILSLHHTWSTNDACDDTPLNPNCWNFTTSGRCKDAISNNVMDYNAHRSAYTPCQLGRIHKTLSTPGSKARNMLQARWCTLDTAATVRIPASSEVVWQKTIDLSGHLIIEANAQLRVLCQVSLPEGARIVLHPNAKLIVDGGTLTNTCQQTWEGIEVLDYHDKNLQERIQVLNRGQILHAKAR